MSPNGGAEAMCSVRKRKQRQDGDVADPIRHCQRRRRAADGRAALRQLRHCAADGAVIDARLPREPISTVIDRQI